MSNFTLTKAPKNCPVSSKMVEVKVLKKKHKETGEISAETALGYTYNGVSFHPHYLVDSDGLYKAKGRTWVISLHDGTQLKSQRTMSKAEMWELFTKIANCGEDWNKLTDDLHPLFRNKMVEKFIELIK